MKLTFLGATGTVTGSKYLLESGSGGDRARILIDCGLFQGLKELRLRNWLNLPVNPASIDAVILTHAHIDHSGYLPLLVKNGFSGRVYCSEATYDLCAILLPDSGFIHEEDARRANRYGYSKHQPAEALYTEKQARHALKQFKVVDFGRSVFINKQTSFSLSRSGHILGSAFITLNCGGKSIVFSGDLGRSNDPLMNVPAKIQHADYLLIESTYGDRLHSDNDPQQVLADLISATVKKGGSLLIPAFAVGRAQTLLYYIHQLKQSGEIDDIPVYLDSPMAISVTKILCKHKNDHRLPKNLCFDLCDSAIYTRTAEESKQIDSSEQSCIVISASGMATGGRVLHHLKQFLVNKNNTILFAGFQAEGTRGDRLVRGEKEIKIHGEIYPVNARVENLAGLSAHADYHEILAWLENFKQAPRRTFVTHGQPKSAEALREKIEEKFSWSVEVPEYMEAVEL